MEEVLLLFLHHFFLSKGTLFDEDNQQNKQKLMVNNGKSFNNGVNEHNQQKNKKLMLNNGKLFNNGVNENNQQNKQKLMLKNGKLLFLFIS